MKAVAKIIGTGKDIQLDGRESEGGSRFTWTIEKLPLGVSPVRPILPEDPFPKGYIEVPGSLVTMADLPSPGDYEFRLTLFNSDSTVSQSVTIPYSFA